MHKHFLGGESSCPVLLVSAGGERVWVTTLCVNRHVLMITHKHTALHAVRSKKAFKAESVGFVLDLLV